MNYPKPFRREGQSSLWFNYVDPVTGKRKLKSTGSSKVGESREYIQNFMDRLTPAGQTTFRNYATQFFSPDTNPRCIRFRISGWHYSTSRCRECGYLLNKYVMNERFAGKVLTEITRGDIIDFISLLTDKYPGHPATINSIIKHITAIFAEAYFRGDVKVNPAMQLTPIRYEKKERGLFSPDEIRDMFSNPSRWKNPLAYHVFMFAAYTGRRAGEIFALQWSQIKDGVCTIDRAYNQVDRGIKEPKWGRCVTFPLCRALVLPPKGDCPYVFHTDKNKPIYMAWWKRMFHSEMENLGIDIKGRNLVPHSFRHSLNTNLLLAMAPELYVKRYIGWSDNGDTQSIYTHIKPEDLRFIADKIDEIYKNPLRC